MKTDRSEGLLFFLVGFATGVCGLLIIAIVAQSSVLGLTFGGLATAGTVVATIVLAYLTWVLANETRLMRVVQTTPTISAFLEGDYANTSVNLIHFVLQNTGAVPAHGIRFEVEPANGDSGSVCIADALSSLSVIGEGLTTLTPGQSVRNFLLNALDCPGLDAGRVNLHLDYKVGGRDFTECIPVDARALMMHSVGSPPLVAIAKHVEDLAKSAKRIVNTAQAMELKTPDKPAPIRYSGVFVQARGVWHRSALIATAFGDKRKTLCGDGGRGVFEEAIEVPTEDLCPYCFEATDAGHDAEG